MHAVNLLPPGLGLMRRLSIAGKPAVIALWLTIPLVFVLAYVLSSTTE